MLNVIARLATIMGELEEAARDGWVRRVKIYATDYPENISSITRTIGKEARRKYLNW
jgi:hypothetical protein